MRILLDSKDLIDVVEHAIPVSVQDLDKVLRAGQHQLVLSFVNISELVGPLWKGAEFTDIRPLLISVESLPVCYLREGTIQIEELRMAVDAFSSNNTPTRIDPYVQRWDEAITPFGQSAMRHIVGLRLWEIIRYLYKQGVLTGNRKNDAIMREQVLRERAFEPASKFRKEQVFFDTIHHNLTTWSIQVPDDRHDQFARFLYNNPAWCPSLRIGFELYRSVVRNRTDVPKEGDVWDFSHLKALPYVDALTVDRRMKPYLMNALRSIAEKDGGLNYSLRVFANLSELLARLSSF